MPTQSSPNPTDPLHVPWPDVVRFIRQLNHDLRNDLNAIELQSSYISELAQGQELQSEVKRLRDVVAGMNSTLQKLSRTFAEVMPSMIPYQAAEFLSDMHAKIDRDFPNESNQIRWDVEVDGTLNVDPQLFTEVFAELFANALRHNRGDGPMLASARIQNNRLFFSLHEPKAGFDAATKNWGREPLKNVSQRHYGLGLARVRSIVEAHGGELDAQHDAKTSALISTIALPISNGRSERN